MMCGRDRIDAPALPALLSLLALLLLPGLASAQTDDAVFPSPGIALVAGVVRPDLGPNDPSGDGGSMLGLRLGLPLSSWIVLEPSLERVGLDDDTGGSVRYQLDFAVRGEAGTGALHPFAGAGLGALLWPGDARPASADFVVATYGVLGGLRYDLTDHFGLRAETRLRWFDGFDTSTKTFAAGVGWRF